LYIPISPGLGEKGVISKQGVISRRMWGYPLATKRKKPRFKMFCFGRENGVYVCKNDVSACVIISKNLKIGSNKRGLETY
jgi:hypothetical protein